MRTIQSSLWAALAIVAFSFVIAAQFISKTEMSTNMAGNSVSQPCTTTASGKEKFAEPTALTLDYMAVQLPRSYAFD